MLSVASRPSCCGLGGKGPGSIPPLRSLTRTLSSSSDTFHAECANTHSARMTSSGFAEPASRTRPVSSATPATRNLITRGTTWPSTMRRPGAAATAAIRTPGIRGASALGTVPASYPREARGESQAKLSREPPKLSRPYAIGWWAPLRAMSRLLTKGATPLLRHR